MLASLAVDALPPAQLRDLAVCNIDARELQEVRSYWSDKGVADSAGNRYSNVWL